MIVFRYKWLKKRRFLHPTLSLLLLLLIIIIIIIILITSTALRGPSYPLLLILPLRFAKRIEDLRKNGPFLSVFPMFVPSLFW